MNAPLPACSGDKPFVFVSYSHQDKSLVYPEIRWLQDHGFEVWWDEGISPGAAWRSELAKTIRECSLLLYFVTPNSVASPQCTREVNFAVDEAEDAVEMVAFARKRGAQNDDDEADEAENVVLALASVQEPGTCANVAVAPIIPGVNDMEVPALLERAREAGARRASSTLLRLPREVKPYFEARLEESLPLRASKVRNALREMRGGRMNDPRFGHRLRGTGTRWQVIEQMFRNHASRLGLDIEESGQNLGPPIPPARRPKRQLELFDHRDT